MGFNQFSTGFVLGAVITGLAALLFARCPRPSLAGERPVSDDTGLRVVKRTEATA